MAAVHGSPTAICWGCGLEVSLPTSFPSFKCGWCGAITLDKQSQRKDSCCVKWFWLRDLATSSALVLLIVFLFGGGIAAIFPVVFPTFSTVPFYFHSAIVALLAFNILFNFVAALKSPPGLVPYLPFGSPTAAPQGALDSCTFCDRCERPKPSRAHHCRTCRTCVMGMDHHCPFIANCVGADNQRVFVLLLLYAMLGGSYATCMGTWAVLRTAPEVFSLARAARELRSALPNKVPSITDAFRLLFQVRVRLSLWLLVTLYITFMSLGVVTLAGFLLKQQLDAAFSGETGIDFMQRVTVDVLPGRGVRERTWAGRVGVLEEVLGRGRPGRWWLWLMPRWPRNFSHTLKHQKAG